GNLMACFCLTRAAPAATFNAISLTLEGRRKCRPETSAEQRMRLVLLGAPGSGKGTQAARLKTESAVPHISSGALLRAAVKAETALGLKAKEVMDAGQLVSDDIVLGMLEARLTEDDARGGFILDGYPRNLAQVKALDGLLERLNKPLDAVVKLDVP